MSSFKTPEAGAELQLYPESRTYEKHNYLVHTSKPVLQVKNRNEWVENDEKNVRVISVGVKSSRYSGSVEWV